MNSSLPNCRVLEVPALTVFAKPCSLRVLDDEAQDCIRGELDQSQSRKEPRSRDGYSFAVMVELSLKPYRLVLSDHDMFWYLLKSIMLVVHSLHVISAFTHLMYFPTQPRTMSIQPCASASGPKCEPGGSSHKHEGHRWHSKVKYTRLKLRRSSHALLRAAFLRKRHVRL